MYSHKSKTYFVANDVQGLIKFTFSYSPQLIIAIFTEDLNASHIYNKGLQEGEEEGCTKLIFYFNRKINKYIRNVTSLQLNCKCLNYTSNI